MSSDLTCTGNGLWHLMTEPSLGFQIGEGKNGLLVFFSGFFFVLFFDPPPNSGGGGGQEREQKDKQKGKETICLFSPQPDLKTLRRLCRKVP